MQVQVSRSSLATQQARPIPRLSTPYKPGLARELVSTLKNIAILLSTLLVLFLISCAETGGYDQNEDVDNNKDCTHSSVNKVAKQLEVSPEELSDLACTDILEIVPGLSALPEKYLLFQEKNVILVTHCGGSNYGLAMAKEAQLAFETIKERSGISPITQCTIYTIAVEGDLKEIETQLKWLNIPFGWGMPYLDCEEIVPPAETGNEVAFVHEPSHLFLMGTLLHASPIWLNEGFSAWMQASLSPFESLYCSSGSWQVLYHQKDYPPISGPYVSLTKTRDEHTAAGTEGAAYKTGACVWQQIYDGFGSEKFMAIMALVEESRFTCLSFVGDILEPIIGLEGVGQLKDRFGAASIEAYR